MCPSFSKCCVSDTMSLIYLRVDVTNINFTYTNFNYGLSDPLSRTMRCRDTINMTQMKKENSTLNVEKIK